MDQYENMRLEATKMMNWWSDPMTPRKEEYPVPVTEIEGQK